MQWIGWPWARRERRRDPARALFGKPQVFELYSAKYTAFIEPYAIGLEQANAVQRELWVQEALATAAIEGEQLNLESLRSSVAHRLQLADVPGTDRSVDGLVQVMQDALVNHGAALNLDRLCRFQSGSICTMSCRLRGVHSLLN